MLFSLFRKPESRFCVELEVLWFFALLWKLESRFCVELEVLWFFGSDLMFMKSCWVGLMGSSGEGGGLDVDGEGGQP